MSESRTRKLTTQQNMLTPEQIERRIYSVRGQNVMRDSDLAELYGVETGMLNRAVRRNIGRFPEDFMFQLTIQEAEGLRFQIGISKAGRGGRRYLPYVFTEQGVAMLSSMLRSERAVQVNIAIMRAFVSLRSLLMSNRELAGKFWTGSRSMTLSFALSLTRFAS
jgi:hypothetical protein